MWKQSEKKQHFSLTLWKHKSTLQKLRITNPLNKKTRNIYDHKEIESLFIKHNGEYVSKDKQTPAYNDKFIKNLNKVEITDKVLNGKLQKEDIDDDVF